MMTSSSKRRENCIKSSQYLKLQLEDLHILSVYDARGRLIGQGTRPGDFWGTGTARNRHGDVSDLGDGEGRVLGTFRGNLGTFPIIFRGCLGLLFRTDYQIIYL